MFSGQPADTEPRTSHGHQPPEEKDVVPINIPDQIRKSFVTASYGHYGQRAARIGPDRICRIQLTASDLVPFFQRRPGSNYAKPAWIRSGWPGQVLQNQP